MPKRVSPQEGGINADIASPGRPTGTKTDKGCCNKMAFTRLSGRPLLRLCKRMRQSWFSATHKKGAHSVRERSCLSHGWSGLIVRRLRRGLQVAIGSWCQIKADMTWSMLHPGSWRFVVSARLLTVGCSNEVHAGLHHRWGLEPTSTQRPIRGGLPVWLGWV